MLRKKGSGLHDLEYAIPKEYRDDMYSGERVVYDEAPQKPHSGYVRESCCMCGKSSDEAVLVPAVYCGKDQWICGKCLSPQERAGESQSNLGSSGDGNSMSMFG